MSRSQREIQVRALMRAGAAAEAAGNLRAAARAYRAAVAATTPRSAARGASRAHARALHGLGHVLQQQGRYRPAASVLRTGDRARRSAHSGATRLRSPPRSMSSASATSSSAAFSRPDRSISGRSTFSNHDWARATRRRRRIYHNLGGLEHSAGNWARGEPFARLSVRIRKRALGSRHPLRRARHDRARGAARSAEEVRRGGAPLQSVNRHLRTGARAGTSRSFGRSQQPGRRSSGAWSAEAGRAAVPPRARHRHDAPRRRSPARRLLREQPRHAAEIARTIFRSRRSVPARRCASSRARSARSIRTSASAWRTTRRSLRALGRRREADACERRAARILARVEAVNDEGVAMTGTINPMYARFRLIAKKSRIHRLGVFTEEPIPPHAS